jgi:hypothetical protein
MRNQRRHTISLSQTSYIDTIVKRLQFKDTYPIHTPIDPNVILSEEMCLATEEERQDMAKFPYMVAVGSLMYMAMGTQPDIAFAVQWLSQYSSNPGCVHWTQAQRAIQYVATTRDFELVLGSTKVLLMGWMDSNWDTDIDNHHSISGYMFSLGGSTISWSAKKQPTIATSSAEGEYMASCHATKECMLLRTLLKLIGFAQLDPTSFCCDNVGSNILTKDATFHARTKHVDIQHHYVREHVEGKDIHFPYIPTHENPADAFTKSLPRPCFTKHRERMGLTDLLDSSVLST